MQQEAFDLFQVENCEADKGRKMTCKVCRPKTEAEEEVSSARLVALDLVLDSGSMENSFGSSPLIARGQQ